MSEVCSTCGLPEELCVCEDVERESQELRVDVEERTFDKPVTVVTGFESDTIDLGDLSSELKSEFACGGTVTDDTIELQGDHEEGVAEELEDRGFTVL